MGEPSPWTTPLVRGAGSQRNTVTVSRIQYRPRAQTFKDKAPTISFALTMLPINAADIELTSFKETGLLVDPTKAPTKLPEQKHRTERKRPPLPPPKTKKKKKKKNEKSKKDKKQPKEQKEKDHHCPLQRQRRRRRRRRRAKNQRRTRSSQKNR